MSPENNQIKIDDRLHLSGGEKIPISRSHHQTVQEKLDNGENWFSVGGF